MASIRLVLALAIVVVVLAFGVNAGFRKPPLNGSIFGKRSSTVIDYEVTGRALSAICEFASDTCNAWLSRQESN